MKEDDAPMSSRILAATLLVQALPFFLTAFVAFAFLRLIFTKLGLVNLKAANREFESHELYLMHKSETKSARELDIL